MKECYQKKSGVMAAAAIFSAGRSASRIAIALALGLAMPALAGAADGPAEAGTNPRGSATGPTTAKGFDIPGHFIHLKPTKPADNMYPMIAHPEQDKEVRQKLADLEARTGKKPNVLIFLMDDVGWMDPVSMAAARPSAIPRPIWTGWPPTA